MLAPTRKNINTESLLHLALTQIFSKTFTPSLFLPLQLQISDDPDFRLPSLLLFSIYNLLIRDEPETAFNGLTKIQNENPNSVANIAALVVRSGYESYMKRYRESLGLLDRAVEMCQGSLDREFCGFYGEVVMRMLEIYQFGAFRRDYLAIMDKILATYQQQSENNEILKLLSKQRDSLKSKLCTLQKNPLEFASLRPGSTKLSKFSFRKKESLQANNSSRSRDREKSSESSKLSNLYSPRSKLSSSNLKQTFRAKKFINPYGLPVNQSQTNKCIFM